MPEPRFDYGEMFTGTPKLSAIDPELFRYDEELVKRQQAEELIPTAPTPKVDYFTGGAIPPVLSPTPRPQPTFDLQGLVKGMSVPIGKMAAEFMGGERTTAGRIGNILAGSSQSMLLNENLKKMLQQYMAGEGGSKSGFPSDQQFGIGSLEAAGLTPEQLGGIYQAGLKTRSEERKWPLEQMGTLADINNKIATGELSAEHLQLYKYQVEKLKEEISQMPANNRDAILEKVARMRNLDATSKKLDIEARYKEQEMIGKLPEDIKAQQALTKEREANARKHEADFDKTMRELDPRWTYTKSYLESMGKQTGQPQTHMYGYEGQVSIYTPPNPSIGQPGGWSPLFTLPGAAGVDLRKMTAGQHSDAINFALGDFISTAKENYIGKFKGEERQKAAQSFQDLLMMMSDSTKSNVVLPQILDMLPSGKERIAFGAAYRVYQKSFAAGDDPAEAGIKAREVAQKVMNPEGKTAGDFSTNPKAKIPPKGKPLVDFDEMISTATKEVPNAMTDSQFEEWSYKKFSEPKGISREVHKAVVRKGIANLRGKTPGGP